MKFSMTAVRETRFFYHNRLRQIAGKFKIYKDETCSFSAPDGTN